MELEYRIPTEDYDHLRRIVGLDVGEVFFERAFNSDPTRCAHMIALKHQENAFIRFCTDEWNDTDKEAINCYRLRIESVACPSRFVCGKSGMPLETEKLLVPTFKVLAIDLYEFRDSESGESVAYDSALLLRGGKGFRLLIGIDNSSIVGDVYLTLNALEMEEKLAGYHYLRTITK